MERESSPWRQPIVWLMVALVGAAIAGSIWLLKVAGNGDSIDAVPDEVQRTGQTQQTDLGPDAAAAQRKLGAIVRIDVEKGFVMLRLLMTPATIAPRSVPVAAPRIDILRLRRAPLAGWSFWPCPISCPSTTAISSSFVRMLKRPVLMLILWPIVQKALKLWS